MKLKTEALLFFFLLASPLLAQTGTGPLAATNFPSINTTCTTGAYVSNAWLMDVMQKVRQDSGSAPSCTNGSYATNAGQKWIVVYCTQGEFCNFQAQWHDTGSGTSGLNIAASSFVQSSPSSYTIPAPSSSQTDVLVYREGYYHVTTETATASVYYGSTGYYPDMLIPTIDPYYHQTTNAWPVTVAASQNQGAWVDVFIPLAAPSGYYLGSITVQTGCSSTLTGCTTVATMPVVLGVWQWPSSGHMPVTSSLPSELAYGAGDFCNMNYPGTLFNSTGCNAGTITYSGGEIGTNVDGAAMFLDHRWSLFDPVDNSGSITTYYPPLFAGTSGKNVNTIIPGARATGVKGSQYLMTNLQTWDTYVNVTNRPSWSQMVNYDYTSDEPGTGAAAWTALCNQATSDHALTPPFATLVTTYIQAMNDNASTSGCTPNVFNAIDIMVTPITSLDVNAANGGPAYYRSSYNSYLANSNPDGITPQLWSYLACSSGGTCGNGTVGGSTFNYPNYNVDSQPAGNRSQEWFTYFHQQTGELYYEATCSWETACYSSTQNDPWVTNLYAFGNNGDGTLVYPSHYQCSTSCGADPTPVDHVKLQNGSALTTPIWVPSMRLKYMRDGMQDYEYINYLKNNGYATYVNTQVSNWITNSYTYEYTGTGLMTARTNLGTTLHEISYPVSGSTFYYSQAGGTFSGGTACNGQSTTAIGSGKIAVTAGNTYYLCGTITTAVNLSGTGTASNPVTFNFDTGARVSLPTCGQGASCFGIGSTSYITINMGIACGAGTTCAANENASPTGYPSGITGIIEATAAGTGLANTPTQGNIFYINGATNVTIENCILRNLYVHPATTAGFNDPNGGGGAFPAVNIVNSNNITVHDCDIHDEDTLVNASNGPNYNNLSFYNNTGFNMNWGLHAGTYGGQVTSNWSVHDNKFATTGNWDQAKNNAHHDQGMFLSRGGNNQGNGSFNRVAFYNNWLTCQTGANTTSAFYISGGPITKLYLYNNVFDYSCNATKAWSDAVLTMVPGNGSSMIFANNTIIDSPNPPGDSGQGCYSFSAVMEFVNNVGKYCNGFVYWQNYGGYGGNGFSGYFDYNVYGEPGTTPTNGYWQDQSGLGTNLNTSTFATWVSHVATLGCVVGTNGCETHSSFCSTSGCLSLGTSGAPQSGSPAISAGVNLTSLCGTDTLLAALCSDTSLGNTLVPNARPSSGAWSAGAYQVAGSAAGVLTATPAMVAFGTITVGTPATSQTITIKNTGNATATGIGTLTLSDTTDYSISSNTCSTSLAANATCTFSLGFTPDSSGSLPATITATYTGTGSPLSISITGSGGAGSYYVQGGYVCNDSGCSTAASTLTYTFPAAQIAGDMNICSVGWYDSTSSITSITSSNSNTYTAVGSVFKLSGYGSMLTYTASSINAGNETVQVKWNSGSSTAAFPEIKCAEYTGVNSVDGGAITSGGTGTTMSSGNLTTTSAADILTGFNLIAHTTNGVEAGWTERYLTASDNILEDNKPGATGTYAATATQTISGQWIMQIVALKPGASTTAPPTFSEPGTFYWTSQTVSISCISCTKIVYTTDKSIPSVNSSGTITNGNLYSTALSFTQPTFLQAIAWTSANGSSSITSAQYNIGSAGAPTAWPIIANGRYLTDSNNNPYMIVGDSEWVDIAYLTPGTTGTMAQLFADRQAHGFNTVLIMAAPGDYTGATVNGAAQDGTLPFTACSSCTYPSGATENNYLLSAPNSAYWTEVQNAANLAAAYNLTVVLGTLDTGINGWTSCTGTQGNSWMKAARIAGNSGMYAFGQYLGTTFSNYKNIIYFSGDDFESWPCTTGLGSGDNTLIYNLMNGINNTDSAKLQTTELNFTTSWSQQDTLLTPLTTLSGVYPQISPYDGIYSGYNAAPTLPCFDIEGIYDYQNILNNFSPWPGGPPPILTASNAYIYSLTQRQQFWWTVTSGCIGGNMYGNYYASGLSGPDGASNWQTYIDSVAASEVPYFVAFWKAINWPAMQPDQTKQVVSNPGTYIASSGSGNWVANGYATTLWNPNGTIAVTYDPLGSALTVNMTKFIGNITAQWFDPSAGTYTLISGSPFANTGTHSFSTPGTNSAGGPDWVLFLQSASAPVQTLPNPTLTPGAGIYATAQSVTISNATSGTTNCVTTDGSTPTTNGAGSCINGTPMNSLTVSASETVKVISTENGYNDSAVVTAGYTINGAVGTPVVAVISGVAPNPRTISITSPTAGATICYAFGVAPTTNGSGTCTSGTTLTNGGPVNITTSVVLYAIGTKSGYTDSALSITTIFVGTIPMNPPTVIILM